MDLIEAYPREPYYSRPQKRQPNEDHSFWKERLGQERRAHNHSLLSAVEKGYLDSVKRSHIFDAKQDEERRTDLKLNPYESIVQPLLPSLKKRAGDSLSPMEAGHQPTSVRNLSSLANPSRDMIHMDQTEIIQKLKEKGGRGRRAGLRPTDQIQSYSPGEFHLNLKAASKTLASSQKRRSPDEVKQNLLTLNNEGLLSKLEQTKSSRNLLALSNQKPESYARSYHSSKLRNESHVSLPPFSLNAKALPQQQDPSRSPDRAIDNSPLLQIEMDSSLNNRIIRGGGRFNKRMKILDSPVQGYMKASIDLSHPNDREKVSIVNGKLSPSETALFRSRQKKVVKDNFKIQNRNLSSLDMAGAFNDPTVSNSSAKRYTDVSKKNLMANRLSLSNVGLKSKLGVKAPPANPYASVNVRSRLGAYHSISKDLLQAKYESQAEEQAARDKQTDFVFSLPHRSDFLTSNLKIPKKKPAPPSLQNPFASSMLLDHELDRLEKKKSGATPKMSEKAMRLQLAKDRFLFRKAEFEEKKKVRKARAALAEKREVY